MSGRNPIYYPDLLKLWGRMEIYGKKKKYGHQLAYNFNKRFKDRMRFRCVADGEKVFIERVV